MKKIVFGTVDTLGGCSPFYSDRVGVQTHLTLVSVPFWRGLRRPVLRKVVRMGLFLEVRPEASDVYHRPRIVITTGLDKPVCIRLHRSHYRVAHFQMGGDLLSLQYYHECMVFPRWGTFVATFDLEYGLFDKLDMTKLVADWYDFAGQGYSRATQEVELTF